MTHDPRELSEVISSLRRPHEDRGLERSDLDGDPIIQFSAWMDEALSIGRALPNSMTLATADSAGRPSARTVLLKGVDERGFVFYTNYLSRKGRELTDNPHAALLFHWEALERQVSVRGPVTKVAAEESDAYFASRPRGSKLGAWASQQSAVIPDRSVLDAAVAELERRFPEPDVARPPHWGGFRVQPDELQFWQARSNRLHDRFRYSRSAQGWIIERLSP